MSEFDPAEVAEQIYGAVADDEGLRGELDDSGYAPLIRWAAEQAEAMAAAPSVDVDMAADLLHDAVAALVAASESGDPEALTAIPNEILPTPTRERLQGALAGAPADRNERAAALALALSQSDTFADSNVSDEPSGPEAGA